MNFNITRRQFLQYCAASAAALGLSQTDLLKLERALATPQTNCGTLSPSVIWLSGQACSGCPVSLLNRVNSYANGAYYDADMLNALYGTSLTLPTALGNDPAGLPLMVVNDAADLLVGDAVRALTGISRGNLWADDMSGVLPGSLLDAYAGAFPTGYVTLDWNATVMAAAGDIPVKHLVDIVEQNGGSLLDVFLVVVDGAIPSADDRYCFVFDNDDGLGSPVTTNLNHGSVTAGDALIWMAQSPGCLGIISMGTCASYGGIPAGVGNKTGAMGVKDYLAFRGVSKAVINVPGCPPHPDWFVYTAAYILANSSLSGPLPAIPPLDSKGRPKAVYSGTGGDDIPFCYDCANKDTQGTPAAAQELGQAGCLGGLGCKGPYTVGDCPIRGKNTADDGTIMNWCVGAQGRNSASGGLNRNIGSARHPCQGCIEPDFPDWAGLTVEPGDKTSARVKGFYNE